MAMKVYAKGRNDAYEAFGVIDGKNLTVKKAVGFWKKYLAKFSRL